MDSKKLIQRLGEKEMEVAEAILRLRDLPVNWLEKPEVIPEDKKEPFNDALLEACALSYKPNDTKVRSFFELGQAYVLFWKGLYPEASEYLNAVKEKIKQRDDFPTLQMLNQIEMHLCSVDWETADFEGTMDSLIKEYVINTHRSIDMLSRWILDSKLNRHLINRGASKNIMDTFDYDHLKEDVFVFRNKNSMSVMASYYQLRAEKHLYELDGNLESLYTTNAEIVKLMEKNPKQFGQASSAKIYAMYHLGNTALKLGKVGLALSAIKKIRNLKPTENISIYDRDNFSLSLEIDMLLKEERFEDVISKKRQASEMFRSTPYKNEMIKEEHKKFYCLQFAIAYLHNGNFAEALKALEPLTDDSEKSKMFKDLGGNAFRIQILANLATRNWEEAENSLEKALKFWEDTQQFNQLEASLSQFTRRCTKTQGQNFVLELSSWREAVEGALSDPLERSSLQNFDLLRWLNDTINRLSKQEDSSSEQSQSA